MHRVIHTNIPNDRPEFDQIQKCFTAFGLDFLLVFDVEMEVYKNTNNVFFECIDDRDRPIDAIVKACNALHRLIINFRLADGGKL